MHSRKEVVMEKDWSNYQNNTLNDKIDNLLLEFLNKYKNVKTIVDLGCGAGNESVYLIKHGYNVISIDRQLNESFILDRLEKGEKKNVKFLESDFKDVIIPNSDCVMAMFSIPFCKKEFFDELWNKIYDSLNEHGYFVGQLFGDRDAWKDSEWVNTFSKDEVLERLEKYEVLLFDEVEFVRKSDNKKWHYYNIIARKK